MKPWQLLHVYEVWSFASGCNKSNSQWTLLFRSNGKKFYPVSLLWKGWGKKAADEILGCRQCQIWSFKQCFKSHDQTEPSWVSLTALFNWTPTLDSEESLGKGKPITVNSVRYLYGVVHNTQLLSSPKHFPGLHAVSTTAWHIWYQRCKYHHCWKHLMMTFLHTCDVIIIICAPVHGKFNMYLVMLFPNESSCSRVWY